MATQEVLDLTTETTLKSIEDYKFEPIKGFPMLHWKGKRPFTSTQFYPAQLRENFGEEVNGWMNKIFWGDNLQVMSHLLKEFRGSIDLIYIDPPYDSKADYKQKIELRGKKINNDSSVFEEKQYTDIWTNDEYLQFMYERLIIMRELLSSTGSIFLHCDWHKSHHIRCILDEIFGNGGNDGKGPGFRNEIIWYYRRWTAGSKSFQKMHDTIFWYSKTSTYKFNEIYIDATEGQKEKHEKGWDRNSVYIEGVRKPQLIVYDKEKVEKAISEGRIDINEFARVVEINKTETIAHDVWEMNYLNSQSKERQNYPTQKPEELINRIIEATTKEGDIVFDSFMGSGTTQAAAMKLNRKFIGADINLGAVQTTTKRLLNVSSALKGQLQDKAYYTGFSVYNVNHYDIFRNPVQAKDILIKALEIQPLPNNNVYDGEKDGRMVKIMPINRIATKADLNELITNFDYKSFEKANEKNPGKPVESLLLVCMGHEPDLAASLQSAVPYRLDIEVVDILRDNARLEFKREAEAEMVIEGSKLIIREYYPMNLLQKLSLMKENVEDWKELVDSVMIDFNYDGAVFEPQIVDVPEGNDLVKGIYNIPANAGTIRVKITDLLSETLDQTVTNG